MFRRINVKKIFIFIDTFIYLYIQYLCIDRILYKPKCTMSEAQIFVNNCIWGTNWLQTGKRQTARTVQLALQRRCSPTFTLFLHESGAVLGQPCKNAHHSTMWDHNTDMHTSISFTAVQPCHHLKLIVPHWLLETLSYV